VRPRCHAPPQPPRAVPLVGAGPRPPFSAKRLLDPAARIASAPMPDFLKRKIFNSGRSVAGPCHPWFDKAITCRADPNAETTEQNATKQPATLEWPDGCSKQGTRPVARTSRPCLTSTRESDRQQRKTGAYRHRLSRELLCQSCGYLPFDPR